MKNFSTFHYCYILYLLLQNILEFFCDFNIELAVIRIGWVGVDWIHLVQDRDRWRGVVNTIIRLETREGVF
jgi:hypothetical protein